MIKGYMTAGDGKRSPLLDISNFQISLEKVGPEDSKANPPQLIGKDDWVSIEKALGLIDQSELIPGGFYEILLDWALMNNIDQSQEQIFWIVFSIKFIDTDSDGLPF